MKNSWSHENPYKRNPKSKDKCNFWNIVFMCNLLNFSKFPIYAYWEKRDKIIDRFFKVKPLKCNAKCTFALRKLSLLDRTKTRRNLVKLSWSSGNNGANPKIELPSKIRNFLGNRYLLNIDICHNYIKCNWLEWYWQLS